MFDIFKKKTNINEFPFIECGDEEIVAPADGKLIDILEVSDPVFSSQMMGQSTAFHFEGEKIVLCSPANGKLTALFSTGHAFGIQMNNGVEFLVHIGINTVESNGKGFQILGKKQGDLVRAGEPIVEISLAKLSKMYDMTTILIVTDANEKEFQFCKPGEIRRGQKII